MKLFVEFFVADLKRSRAFYIEALGMKVTNETAGYIELVLGQAQINLCLIGAIRHGHFLSKMIDSPVGSRTEFCFEVEDIEASYDKAVKAGAQILEPIRKMPWGRTDFRLADPDGAYLRITTTVAD
jgi:lactoylglutathione lyase